MNWTARASSLTWWSVASSSDGTKLVAAEYNGRIYTPGAGTLVASGSQSPTTALQYLGNGDLKFVREVNPLGSFTVNWIALPP